MVGLIGGGEGGAKKNKESANDMGGKRVHEELGNSGEDFLLLKISVIPDEREMYTYLAGVKNKLGHRTE